MRYQIETHGNLLGISVFAISILVLKNGLYNSP